MQSAAAVGIRCGARKLCRGAAGTRELAAKVAFVCVNGESAASAGDDEHEDSTPTPPWSETW